MCEQWQTGSREDSKDSSHNCCFVQWFTPIMRDSRSENSVSQISKLFNTNAARRDHATNKESKQTQNSLSQMFYIAYLHWWTSVRTMVHIKHFWWTFQKDSPILGSLNVLTKSLWFTHFSPWTFLGSHHFSQVNVSLADYRHTCVTI